MLDRESSVRLSLLRFPLIVGVVFIHAYSSTVGFAGREIGAGELNCIADFIRNFISMGVARIAVPLFFLIAGYLFFYGFEFSIEKYKSKIKSRSKTLLIPFLFWNITTLITLAIAQSMDLTKDFFSGSNQLIKTFNTFDYFNAIVGATKNPIAYQFWFIRDLIALVIISPAIYLLIRLVPKALLFFALINWVTGALPLYIPSAEAILFFSFGAFLGNKSQNIFHLDNYGGLALILYFFTSVLDTLSIGQPLNIYIHKTSILLGILCALFSTKFILQKEKLKNAILRLSEASFFVYAIHEPMLTIFKKISYKALTPESSISIILLYFTIPTITIIFAVIAYQQLVKIAPRFVSTITGGR